MERIELLQARISLYRRYLNEGANGDMANAYLWLIRKDEIELTTIAESHKPVATRASEAVRSMRSSKPKDD
jgi:hypothetical protein